MEEGISKTVAERFESIVFGKSTDDVMITIFNTAPFLNTFSGVNLKDYYFNAEIKLGVQVDFQKKFPQFLCLPGIWADFGALVEPSAFGCAIEWPDDGMPMAQPVLKSDSDIRALAPINPTKDGMMPQALADYRYLHDHLDPRYIDEYGYLNGVACSFGPVELAAVLIGHENFYMNLITSPQSVHDLLKITTESVIRWLKAHEEINGPLRRLIIADHIPGQIGLEHYEEFWLPYSNRVVGEFPNAIIIYHNEFPVPYVKELRRFHFHVFHFGGDLSPVKEALGDRITLMGNLHPVNLMYEGSPQEVQEEAIKILKQGSTGGKFLLSTAGGVAPETPIANFEAMNEALSLYVIKGM